jgi:hypothetical protein
MTREVEAALAMNPDDVAVRRFLRSVERLERSREKRASAERESHSASSGEQSRAP